MLPTVMIEQIRAKIDKLEKGEKFTLPSLFKEDWAREVNGSDIGKAFKQAVQDGDIKNVRLLDARANPAHYAKK